MVDDIVLLAKRGDSEFRIAQIISLNLDSTWAKVRVRNYSENSELFTYVNKLVFLHRPFKEKSSQVNYQTSQSKDQELDNDQTGQGKDQELDN